MPTINDRIGSQNIIRVLANASAPPTRVNNLVDVNSTRKDETGATGYLLIWDRVTQKYNLGNDIAAGINVQGISTFTSHVDFGEVNFSGVTTAPTLVATESIAIGETTIVNADRQLQNIASLDATTTATIESAISNAPNTFTDLQVTGISTFVGASIFNSVSTFNLGLNVATGVATFTPAVDMNGGLDVSGGVGLNVVGHTELDNVNVSGVSTFAGAIDANGNLDVDGFTELDDVNVSGAITATTFTGNLAGTVNTAAQPNITSLGTLTGLDVNGHSELDNLNVSGVSTFVGVSTFSGDVYVGGDLYLSDDLVLDNITGNSLKITGLSTFVGNAQFDGNVSIAGTLTYEDVTNVDSVGIVTAGKGVRVTTGGIVVTAGVSTFTSAIDANGSANISGGSTLDRLFLSGITTFKEDVEFHGNGGANALYWDKSADALKLVDDVKILIGTGLDMELYHNGDYSYLDNNTGNLYIRNNVNDDDGGNIYLQAKSGEDSIIANDDGSVEVFYDGARRIETLGAGTTFTDDVFTNRFFEGSGAVLSGVITATGGIDGGSY
ncbi:MAG: hypothetical protein CMD28_01295 [Flavobacteriales bacterium]|nr:hypothetical protein [Flavobacteriales bacterium]|tara:strand:+ start:13307 stop:14965 length:1659 start_codon:yes stop_codon:yes gene_type:complete